jgi:hypothetical protein
VIVGEQYPRALHAGLIVARLLAGTDTVILVPREGAESTRMVPWRIRNTGCSNCDRNTPAATHTTARPYLKIALRFGPSPCDKEIRPRIWRPSPIVTGRFLRGS